MSNIKVSIDRIVIEYRDVYWSFFNPFKQNICDYYGIKEYIGKTGFKYHLHIREYPDHYFHISYQPYHEPKSMKHTLRIETHPDPLEYFQPILDGLKVNQVQGAEEAETKGETSSDYISCPPLETEDGKEKSPSLWAIYSLCF
ncbi:hypothetical protein [Aneurinibacillus sp. UBA3580]|uniref:hypothetical protein n=1 Tax=Aneurinibacillus sp. UBA3580 TaxID=1946041 RepID=UPI00257CA38D|nr:hypothetical protein [Aneurinibacillus sp. UBA3580]